MAAFAAPLIGAGLSALGGIFGKKKDPNQIYNERMLYEAIHEADLRQAMAEQRYPEFTQWGRDAGNYIDQANPYIDQSQQYLSQISPIIDQAQGYISGVDPMISEALKSYRGMSGPANNLESFLKQRMDLGSPYYAEHQRQAAENVTRSSDAAAGKARQQMAVTGMTGGAQGAALGGMAMGESQSLAEAFLANLFNNENVQMQAAGMLPQVADIRQKQGQGISDLGGLRLQQASGTANLGNLRAAQAQGSNALASQKLNQGNAKMSQASLFAPSNFLGGGTMHNPIGPVQPQSPSFVGALPQIGDIIGNIANRPGQTPNTANLGVNAGIMGSDWWNKLGGTPLGG